MLPILTFTCAQSVQTIHPHICLMVILFLFKIHFLVEYVPTILLQVLTNPVLFVIKGILLLMVAASDQLQWSDNLFYLYVISLSTLTLIVQYNLQRNIYCLSFLLHYFVNIESKP
jgi:hypothetical protein